MTVSDTTEINMSEDNWRLENSTWPGIKQ